MKYKKWTLKEKLEILAYAESNGTVTTCRKYGVSTATFYSWKKKHEEMGEAGFRHDDQTPERNKTIGKAEQYAPDFGTFFETAL